MKRIVETLWAGAVMIIRMTAKKSSGHRWPGGDNLVSIFIISY